MTKTVSIDDAQTQLLKLLAYAEKGNEVIITKDNKPLARLVSISPKEADNPRVAGLNEGKIWMSDDFDSPLPDDFWISAK